MKRRTWIGLAVGVAVIGGIAAVIASRGGNDEVKWRYGKIETGDVTQKINATGSLNALLSVPVGTQVSGVVTSLSADFNSIVKKGQVIARIDPTVWETQLRDAQASLERAKATYDNAKFDYDRNKRLFENKLIAQADLDAKDLALKTAISGVASAKASLERAQINLGYCTITAPVNGIVVSRVVDEGQTVAASFSTPNLFTIAQDLSKLKVQAGIDEADIGGVAVGQPALFTVDAYPDRQFMGRVTEVQLNPVVNNNVVQYNVVMEVTNEPRVKTGGDAGPRWGRKAEGDKSDAKGQAPAQAQAPGQAQTHGGWGGEKRAGWGGPRPEGGAWAGKPPAAAPAKSDPLDSQTIKGQPVTIESSTARYIPAGAMVYKGDYALFPGMTANVSILTVQHKSVLKVPNAALRFNPNAFLKAETKPGAQNAAQPGQRSAGGNKGGMMVRREDKVWVLENGKPKAVPVKAGATDGQFTEISGEGLSEGMQILIGVDSMKSSANSGPSPMIGGGPGGPPRR